MTTSGKDKNVIISMIVTAIKSLGFTEVYEGQLCRRCHRPSAFEFCSEACALDFWKTCREHYQKSSGRKICGYPGCSNPCYVEHGRIHDYCGWKHASEHKAMQDRGRRQHWQQQQQRHNSSQHNSHPQSTRSQSDHSSWWSWSSKHATGPINFYNRDDPYYEFTNFYSAPIEVDRKTWPTTEHYFQAQKFVGTPYEEQIRHLPRPRQAFDFTRDPKVSRWRRNDWESIKEDVMYKALLAKFTQHSYLRKLLLGTEERKLVEHSPYDSYWGDGGDGTGKNRLGELLMRLRRKLQSGQKGKKGATHNQQEVTSEQFQHSSPQSGQGWEQNDNTPRSSEHGNCNYQASHSCLLRKHLHPTDPACQLSNSGDSTADRDPPNQQGSTMHMPGSVPCYLNPPTSAANTAFVGSQQPPHQPPSNTPGTVFDGSQPSTSKVDLSSYQQLPWQLATPANGQHNQIDQQRRDSATHDEKMDFIEAGDAGKQGK